jgi:hypothetical protein
MRVCLCIGIRRVLQQLKKKKEENTAKHANNDWDDDKRRAFLLGGYIMRYARYTVGGSGERQKFSRPDGTNRVGN